MSDVGMTPYAWQRAVLESTEPRLLLACSRQVGKSYVTAALALKTAILEGPALVLLVAPTLRQSGELLRDKVLKIYDRLGRPVPLAHETALSVELRNGSRIISLPDSDAGIVGFSSVDLLVVDEAARVSDQTYYSVRPMLAASPNGRIVCLSTPKGKRGWFHHEWAGRGGEGWRRFEAHASDCPHFDQAFLAEERASMGARWYAQEYDVSFVDAVDAVFSDEDVSAAMTHSVKPLFENG